MQLFIIVFGLLIAAAGVTMLVSPRLFIDFVRRYADRLSLQFIAAAARLVLGIVLIFYGDQSRFPLLLQALGCFSIAAAVFILILPRVTFRRLIEWSVDVFASWARPFAPFVVLFGGFLVYAVS